MTVLDELKHREFDGTATLMELAAIDEIERLRLSLHDMLDVYWGKGDGHTPPEFIQRAAKGCGFQLSKE